MAQYFYLFAIYVKNVKNILPHIRHLSKEEKQLKLSSQDFLQNSQENTCTRVSFLIELQAETLAQVSSCEFC